VKYFVRSGSLQGYSQLVKSLGGDSQALLAQCNLTQKDLNQADQHIDFESMVKLLEISAEQLNCADFALRLSSKQGVQILGPLGLLIKNSATARDALLAAQRYMAVHSQGEYWRLREDGDLACIERLEPFHGVSYARQYKELSFGVCYRLITTLLGPNVPLERFEFAHAPISPEPVYRQFFNTQVAFNQEYDRLIIKSALLDQPMPEAKEEEYRAVEQYLMGLIKPFDGDIERQVQTLILQTLGLKEHSIDNIAAMLNMHKRTLQRRLKDADLNFKEILNNVRVKAACWQLESSKMDMTLLSEMLGYSDVSAFSRAFKLRTGLSPLQWRKKMKNK